MNFRVRWLSTDFFVKHNHIILILSPVSDSSVILSLVYDLNLRQSGFLYPVHTSCCITCDNPIWGDVPVLGSPSVFSMRPCESLMNRPLPSKAYGSFKL